MAKKIIPKSFSPSADLAQTLGLSNKRWGALYIEGISDGKSTLAVSDLFSRLDDYAEIKKYTDNRYQVGGLNYYTDPAGDTAQNTPGTLAAPFKSPMQALRILRKRFDGIDGTAVINVRPGNYDTEGMSITNNPLGNCVINIVPTDINDLPTLNISGSLIVRGGIYMTFGPMNYNIAGNINISNGANVTMGTTAAPSTYTMGVGNSPLISADFHGTLNMRGVWNFDGSSGGGGLYVFNSTKGHLSAITATLNMRNFTKSMSIFAHTIGGNIDARSMIFDVSDTVINTKHYGRAGAVIWTGGAGENYFPGINNGSLDSSSFLV